MSFQTICLIWVAALLAGLPLAAAPRIAAAQEGIPPTIILGAPPTASGAGAQSSQPATGAAETGIPDAEAAKDTSPLIQLQPPAERRAPAGTTSTPEIAPIAIERDRATVIATGQDNWLLPISTDPGLPRDVRIGESLPAPGILRLTGEVAEARLSLDMPVTRELPDELQLTLRSGVDVLLEQALLAVSINGGPATEVALRSIGYFTTVTISASGLQPGANSIALTLRQPHRIYCGPDASFQVWTEFDLSRSGAPLPPGVIRPDAAGFALAMGAQLAHEGALPLMVEQDVDPALLRRAADQVMGSLQQRGLLRVVSFYEDPPPRYAAVALIASDRSAVRYRTGASNAIILQIEYQGDTLPDIVEAVAAAPPHNMAPPAVVPGTPISLAELGSADIIANTRYFRRDIDFVLPDDWLVLANQKARLTLRYGFARLLPEGSLLLVKVNDQTVRLLPLDRDGGGILPPLPVGFNANLLHPGRNILSFEMIVPGSPPDEACPASATDMMVALAESTLNVPGSPSMMLPGMAYAISGLIPANVTVPPSAAADLDLQSSAIRLASALNAPEHPRAEVHLTLARLGDLGNVPLDLAGVSQGQLQALLFPRQMAGVAADAPPAPASYTLDLPSQQAVAGSPGIISQMWAWARGRMFSQERLWRDADSFRQAAFQGSQLTLSEWMAGRRGQALLWQPDRDAPDSLWLLLGPQASAGEVGARLESLIAARSAIGEAAVLTQDGTWEIWTPIRPPQLSQPLLGGDLRAILGNYASWSPLFFTLSLLALALLSALPALLYVLASREPKENR